MSEEILVNFTPTETRVAVIENGSLQEIYIERTRNKGIVGNIYFGKVVRVLPGMQAAFVDVGLEKACFLHASDMAELSPKPDGEIPDIRTVCREGQWLAVRVVKDPLSTKGARVSTKLSISSRYLVYMKDSDHIGISQKIEDDGERERLRKLVQTIALDSEDGLPGGYIVRTVAENCGEDEIRADIHFMKRLWSAIQRRLKRGKDQRVIYEDLPLFMRTMRDMVRPDLEKIRIDSKETYQSVLEFAKDYLPEIATRIEYYPGERPIFDLFGVEDEIQKALQRKVDLKSGGYLIIDQTEAMTTIDINTGGFVGHRNLEETIFKTNLEAATSLARQLRVRNLGGIIIIDFIDMKDSEHQRQVLRALERAIDKDHAKINMTGFSDLGLVQMTRKRTRESLEHVMCEGCKYCNSRGSLKSPETVCYEIFREILREARAYDAEKLMVLASQEVVDRLLDEESDAVADLEEFMGRPIQFQVESLYTQEQFDVVIL